MQPPGTAYRAMHGFDLFGGTPPSAFTAAHIDPSVFDQHHQEDDQDHHYQQPAHGQGTPQREIRPRQCHTGCPLPAPRDISGMVRMFMNQVWIITPYFYNFILISI